MSLEEKLEIKTQQLTEKKQAEANLAEEKRISDLRQKIGGLEAKKEKIIAPFDNLQELAGLQQNEVKDYLKTKKVIEGLLEKHRETLAEEGIKDKKGIISAYPKEDEIKAHKQTHQELKTTAKKILKERERLKKQGIENVHGKKLASEIKEKTGEFDKKVKEFKLQTPEGKEEKKQEFKNRLEIKAWDLYFNRKIDGAILVTDDFLKEAKNFGEDGEKIVKETIAEVFQERNEEVSSLLGVQKDLEFFQESKRKIPELAEKLKLFEEYVNNDFPLILDKEIKGDKKIQELCERTGFNSGKEISSLVLRNTPIGHEFKDWLMGINEAHKDAVDVIKTDFRRFGYSLLDYRKIEEYIDKIRAALQNFKENFYERLRTFGTVGLDDDIYQIVSGKRSDYYYKPSQETGVLIAKDGLYETKEVIDKKIEKIRNKLLAKINIDWFKAEEDLFRRETPVSQIEDKERNIQERKRIAEKAIGELISIKKNFNNQLGGIIKIDRKEVPDWNGREKMIEFFYSPDVRNEINQIENQGIELREEADEISSRIREMENKGANIFKKKSWQAEIDKLKSRKKALSKEAETLGAKYQEQREKESQLKGLNEILQVLNLGQDFGDRELTIKEAINAFRDKLRFIQSEEKLPPEEQAIYQNWQVLEKKIKEAEDKYLKAKQELPDF